MAISKLYSDIGRLGTELAQQHYATTTDLDGVLPWLPTDADRQELVALLGGRQPTLEEGRVFEAGYRESIHRLDGNANSVLMNRLALNQFFDVLARQGVGVPPDGSPERREVEVRLSQLVRELKDYIAERMPKPPEEPAQGAAQAEGTVGVA